MTGNRDGSGKAQEVDKSELHVVLVEPEIHWNVGNVGRTCLAVGAKLHLVRPLGFSLSDRRVKRAGLDYWPRVNPKMWASFEALEDSLPSLGTPYFVSPHAPRTLWDVGYPPQTVLLFGRESVGFAPEIREKWTNKLVGIPMLDQELRSLNLSSCVAIVVYEVMRQWRSERREETKRIRQK